VKQYSDVTKERWSDVWKISIIEFLQIIAFNIRYQKEEAEYIKKYKQTH